MGPKPVNLKRRLWILVACVALIIIGVVVAEKRPECLFAKCGLDAPADANFDPGVAK